MANEGHVNPVPVSDNDETSKSTTEINLEPIPKANELPVESHAEDHVKHFNLILKRCSTLRCSMI